MWTIVTGKNMVENELLTTTMRSGNSKHFVINGSIYGCALTTETSIQPQRALTLLPTLHLKGYSSIKVWNGWKDDLFRLPSGLDGKLFARISLFSYMKLPKAPKWILQFHSLGLKKEYEFNQSILQYTLSGYCVCLSLVSFYFVHKLWRISWNERDPEQTAGTWTFIAVQLEMPETLSVPFTPFTITHPYQQQCGNVEARVYVYLACLFTLFRFTIGINLSQDICQSFPSKDKDLGSFLVPDKTFRATCPVGRKGTKADGEITEERGKNRGGKKSYGEIGQKKRWRETDEPSGHARPGHPSVKENELL